MSSYTEKPNTRLDQNKMIKFIIKVIFTLIFFIPVIFAIIIVVCGNRFRWRPWRLFTVGALLLILAGIFGYIQLYMYTLLTIIKLLRIDLKMLSEKKITEVSFEPLIQFVPNFLMDMLPASIGLGILFGGIGLWLVIHRPEYLRLPLKQPVERSKGNVRVSNRVKIPTVHNGVALGVNIDGSPVVLHDEELNMHAFICGSTGTGKTNTLLVILESAIRRGKPVIVVDGKGDPGLIKDLEELSQRYDRRFQKFSYRDRTHYNPFRHGDATELKDKLVAIEEWSEPYYKRAAERYLQLVFRVLKLLDMPIDLIEVQKMLDSKRLMQAVKKLKIDKEEANDMKNYINGLDAGHKNAIEGLKDRLALITESDIGPLFKDDEDAIDLLEAVQDKRVVIMSLSGLSHSSFTPALGAMIVEDLKTVAASMGAVEKEDHIYVVLDEFNLFAGEQVVNMINKSRSAGFCCLIATQELADLATAGGQELVAQVIGNTNVKIVHRQDVPSSAEYMAEVVGTKRIYEKTLMTEESLLGNRPSLMGSVREGEEFIVHPNVLKNLRRGEAVVIKKIPETTVDKTNIRLAEI